MVPDLNMGIEFSALQIRLFSVTNYSELDPKDGFNDVMYAMHKNDIQEIKKQETLGISKVGYGRGGVTLASFFRDLRKAWDQVEIIQKRPLRIITIHVFF